MSIYVPNRSTTDWILEDDGKIKSENDHANEFLSKYSKHPERVIMLYALNGQPIAFERKPTFLEKVRDFFRRSR